MEFHSSVDVYDGNKRRHYKQGADRWKEKKEGGKRERKTERKERRRSHETSNKQTNKQTNKEERKEKKELKKVTDPDLRVSLEY